MVDKRIILKRRKYDNSKSIRNFIIDVLRAYNDKRITLDEMRGFLLIVDRLQKNLALDIEDLKERLERLGVNDD